MLGQLERAVSRSPYNFDLKLRTIYFLDKLGYYDQILQILETMDIKAVQFDTLGFLYLRQIINYSLFDTNDALLVRMVRSYQENFRESSEYAYKAIKAASFAQCEENLCYHKHMEQSYNWSVLLYTLYLKHRAKPEADFYLGEVLERLKSPQTFNCDFRVFSNSVDPDGWSYSDFYGILNSPGVLRNECYLRQILSNLLAKKPVEEAVALVKEVRADWKVSDIYSFDDFSFF